MIEQGNKAIDYLASRIHATDSGASSHWQKYHSNFKYYGDRFEGLQGFGGTEKKPHGITRKLHSLLQKRFRKFAHAYPSFNELDKLALHMTESQDRAYNLDVLRQVLTLAFLKEHRLALGDTDAYSCVIGDGFASMTTLLLASKSVKNVVLVNLTKTLLVDLYYLKQWMGETQFDKSVVLLNDVQKAGALSEIIRQPDQNLVIAVQADNHQLIRNLPIDLVINIASMQEMNPATIESYFADFREIAAHNTLHFYCCNRERKILPDGTTTYFDQYPWSKKDSILVDELCPWHQQYYSLRPPFYRSYDGPIRHRLAELGV